MRPSGQESKNVAELLDDLDELVAEHSTIVEVNRELGKELELKMAARKERSGSSARSAREEEMIEEVARLTQLRNQRREERDEQRRKLEKVQERLAKAEAELEGGKRRNAELETKVANMERENAIQLKKVPILETELEEAGQMRGILKEQTTNIERRRDKAKKDMEESQRTLAELERRVK